MVSFQTILIKIQRVDNTPLEYNISLVLAATRFAKYEVNFV